MRYKMIIKICALFIYASFFVTISEAEDYRNWTSKDGRVIEAKFIKFVKDKVEIQRKDGRSFKIDKTAFSEKDIEYLDDLYKRSDSRGYLWDDASARYQLKSRKWFDSLKDRPILYYHEFKSDRVDLDKDGKIDGMKVQKKANKIIKEIKIAAWDVTEDGKLIYRFMLINRIHEAKYEYDFQKKSFIKIEGHGPQFFIPAG